VDRLRDVGYVPQDPNTLLFAPTVRDELHETERLLRQRNTEATAHWLDALGLTHLADRHPRSLSAGERQRVAVAAVAVGGPDVLLLDEPTRGMDAGSRAALESALRAHAAIRPRRLSLRAAGPARPASLPHCRRGGCRVDR
jgi:energy-coupling factor transport system ATP-binding protein